MTNAWACDRRTLHRRGFTLVEATVSTFIVGVVLVAALRTVDGVALTRRTVARRCQGPALARQLMTEILGTYYQDPGGTGVFGPENGESGSNRTAFDDVDDYNGWSESPPQAIDGTWMADYPGWSRSVSVNWVDPNNPANTSSAESGLKRITVTVTEPDGKQTVLVGLRAPQGVGELKVTTSATILRWAGVDLQLGNAPARIRTGTNVLNQPAKQP
jgi:type II secretory pathway pseudopilin PulG